MSINKFFQTSKAEHVLSADLHCEKNLKVPQAEGKHEDVPKGMEGAVNAKDVGKKAPPHASSPKK